MAAEIVITLTGSVDVDAAPTLRQNLETAINSGADLVIDMSGVRFIDSTGLGALVWARELAGPREQSITLRSMPGNVHRLFDLMGLSVLFRFDDPEGRSDPG